MRGAYGRVADRPHRLLGTSSSSAYPRWLCRVSRGCPSAKSVKEPREEGEGQGDGKVVEDPEEENGVSLGEGDKDWDGDNLFAVGWIRRNIDKFNEECRRLK